MESIAEEYECLAPFRYYTQIYACIRMSIIDIIRGYVYENKFFIWKYMHKYCIHMEINIYINMYINVAPFRVNGLNRVAALKEDMKWLSATYPSLVIPPAGIYTFICMCMHLCVNEYV
jgi:hypothetical protein